MVQASLPKIIFGHNATLPSEREAREAAKWLCGYVSSETGLIFTIDDIKAFRIDYTRDMTSKKIEHTRLLLRYSQRIFRISRGRTATRIRSVLNGSKTDKQPSKLRFIRSLFGQHKQINQGTLSMHHAASYG